MVLRNTMYVSHIVLGTSLCLMLIVVFRHYLVPCLWSKVQIPAKCSKLNQEGQTFF